MWIPESAAEVERAVSEGALPKIETFDAKAAFPEPKRNATGHGHASPYWRWRRNTERELNPPGGGVPT